MPLLKKYYPLFFLFTIIVVFLRNILFPSAGQILSAGDIKHIYYPYREFLKTSLIMGEIPFWNPYIFSGTPFLAHPYTEIFYPTTLPLIFLPSNLYFSIVIFLHILFAAISMYILMQKFTDKSSSFAAALVFSISGFFASRIYAGHLDYIISTALIPFIVLKGYEYITEGKKKALFWGTVVLTFQIFTGLLIMTFYILGILFIWNLLTFRNIKKNFVIFGKRIIIFSISSLLLSFAYLLPSWQFISQTIRGEGLTYNLASYGSSTFQSLLLFINPYLLGSDFNLQKPYHGPPPDYAGFVYYIGLTPLIIILLAILVILSKIVLSSLNSKLKVQSSKPQLKTKILSFLFIFPINFNHRLIFSLIIITLLSVWISLGPHAPINLHYLFWRFLDLYKTTRLPVRHLVIAVFSLSVLFGLSLSFIRFKIVKIIIIALIIIELFSFGNQFLGLDQLSSLLPDDPVVQKITSLNEYFRILPDFTLNSPVREQISFASPLLYRYFSTSGYTPAILTNYYDYIDKINGITKRNIELFSSEITPSIPTLTGISFLNARYIIVDNSADFLAGSPKNYPKLQETPLYRIYENKSVFPRFYFVPKNRIYNSLEELKKNIVNDQNDFASLITMPSTEVYKVKNPPNCKQGELSVVEVKKYSPEVITLSIASPCNGFLSTSEVFYPGWEATIDGINTEMIQSNLAFKAVNIPAGKHEIKMYYNPKIWIISAVISLITLFSLMLYVILPLARKQ